MKEFEMRRKFILFLIMVSILFYQNQYIWADNFIMSSEQEFNVYDGVDYSSVFNPEYYLNRYPDLKSVFGNDQNRAIEHFVLYGMKEGRQGNKEFDVYSYRGKNEDLRAVFGKDLPSYYEHYMYYGKNEGRDGTSEGKTCEVRFIDKNGNNIIQQVPYGGWAVAPENIEQNNFFKGWDKDFLCILDDVDINAIYGEEWETPILPQWGQAPMWSK